MKIHKITAGPLDTNTYLVGCETTKKVLIIDPAKDSFSAILDWVEQGGWEVVMIGLTHSHWDHIADLSVVKQCFDVPIHVHAMDAPNVARVATGHFQQHKLFQARLNGWVINICCNKCTSLSSHGLHSFPSRLGMEPESPD